MIVNKAVKEFSCIKTPLLFSELAVERVCYLEHIKVVEAGEQALIAFVIGHAVKHFGIHPAVVIAVECFAHQPEIVFQPLAMTVQFLQKIKVEAVRNIEAKSVNVELLYPTCDDLL